MSQGPFFSLKDVAEATGTQIKLVSGTAYGVLLLDVPLSGNRVLQFRQGDDPDDQEVKVWPEDHPYILNNL